MPLPAPDDRTVMLFRHPMRRKRVQIYQPLLRGVRPLRASLRKDFRCMEDTTPPPEPPACLKDAGSRFWVDLFAEYEFPGSPEMVMLVEEAAKTADVVARLQRIVDEAPMLRTRGSRGQDVAIPELDALRAFRAQFAALVRQLDLPGREPEDEDDDRQRPMTRSEVGRRAAAARWANRKGY